MPVYWFCVRCSATTQVNTIGCSACQSPTLVSANVSLSFEDFSRLLSNWAMYGEVMVGSIDRWIGQLASSVHQLLVTGEAAPYAEAVVFWLKLHGAVIDLPGRFDSIADHVRDADLSKLKANGIRIVARAMNVRHHAQRLKDALTRDEHIYLEWARNREAHMIVNSYRLQLKGQNQLRDSFSVKALGEDISVDEQWEAIDRVVAAHGGPNESDLLVALAFARKLQHVVNDLATAQRAYMRVAGEPDQAE